MTTNKCKNIGALIVDRRVVSELPCEIDQGHAGPHRVTLEWFDTAELPDLALFDPDEIFDVEVPAT